MMNNQEIFTTVKNHLLTQNQRSVGDNSNCKYRGPNGTKCAVGCLIPDELYSERFEGRTVAGLPSEVLNHIGGDLELLHGLQRIHDHVPVESWRVKLASLASELDLSMK